MSDEDRNDKLIAAASGLATEISPERDLWPEIAEGIAAPKRSRWTPMLAQAAAIVLLIGASSGVTFLAVKDEPQPVVAITPELLFEQTSLTSPNALGPEYLQTRADIAAQLDKELQRLSPATRAEVQANLALIRNAITEINLALEDEPNNVLLQELLLRAYQDELGLMHKVGGLTRHVMSRKDI